MARWTALALAVIAFFLGAIIVQNHLLRASLEEIPKDETHSVKIMEPTIACVEADWYHQKEGSQVKKHVVLKYTFRSEGNENESVAEFHARADADIALHEKACPPNCPENALKAKKDAPK